MDPPETSQEKETLSCFLGGCIPPHNLAGSLSGFPGLVSCMGPINQAQGPQSNHSCFLEGTARRRFVKQPKAGFEMAAACCSCVSQMHSAENRTEKLNIGIMYNLYWDVHPVEQKEQTNKFFERPPCSSRNTLFVQLGEAKQRSKGTCHVNHKNMIQFLRENGKQTIKGTGTSRDALSGNGKQ